MPDNAIDKEWLASLKEGDTVLVKYTDRNGVSCAVNGTVRRILKREIEVIVPASGRHTFSRTYKFRRSDGKRWPLNAYSFELWRIEKP